MPEMPDWLIILIIAICTIITIVFHNKKNR